MKTRNILTANEMIKRGIDPQININVPKGVETNEGSYDGITDKLFDIIHHKGAFYYGN
ncbi:hypothetical protein [Latilactobacillus sakei]|uniref:hypothetical protein n=1 Tax=Latilactobacillus sakei TaxID=1599 RepID=UPI0015F338AC|nr:hypothetical protein [Latilactobacillus sakei]